jgi:myo-inositol-1(or 4)-monophosphatase
MNDERVLKEMLKAVRTAVGIVRRYTKDGPLQVTEKTAAGDLVSNVDLEVEAAVTKALSRPFPDIPMIGEEGENARGTAPGGHSGTKEEAFYLDPVDGTLNFVHGLPPFAVSLGYWREGKPAAAVVCNPVTGDLFSAVRGGGARRNGKPIHVSRAATLRESLIAAGWPYDRSNRHALYAEKDRVYCVVQELREIGCASLGLCYVACGIFEGFWEWGLKPWDLAAGVLLVEEAGGRVSAPDGGPFRLEGGGAAATNGLIHEEFVRTLRG